MQFQIELLTISKQTVPTAKGSYDKYEVAFKKDGKVEGKTLLSFSAKEAIKVLATAQMGQVFTVESVKNDKGYWDWVKVTPGGAPEGTAQASTSPAVKSSVQQARGDWETREERNLRQLHIIRQSSLAQAVATLKTDKAVPKVEDVLDLAQVYVGFIYSDWLKETQPNPQAGVADLPDDLPWENV